MESTMKAPPQDCRAAGLAGQRGRSAETSTDRSSSRGSSTSSKPSYTSSRHASPDAAYNGNMAASWLYAQQLELLWTTESASGQGVVVREYHSAFTCRPSSLEDEAPDFVEGCRALKASAAMTIGTKCIEVILQRNRRSFVQVGDLRLQVLQSMKDLPHCQKNQRAALITDEKLLVVWSDEPRKLLAQAQQLQDGLVQTIWKSGSDSLAAPDAEIEAVLKPWYRKTPKDKDSTISVTEVSSVLSNNTEDIECNSPVSKQHRVVLNQASMTALTMMLTMTAIGFSWRKVATEIAVTGCYSRLLFVLVMPAQMWLGLFFFQSIITSLVQLLGPVEQAKKNSKYYSGKRPHRLPKGTRLPHVTVQMPVYKENLATVLKPTIQSLQAAVSTYEMQGGTANIFVNDDGMQLLDEEQAQARFDFYSEHYIGWVARPPHDPQGLGASGKGFVRAGKFKKASNMNHAMAVSNKIEEKMASHCDKKTSMQDAALRYAQALDDVEAEEQGRTWLDGDIRLGDYILLVDSDTRVPSDCLLDAVTEMVQSPEVAILQFTSSAMKVSQNNFFESAMGTFLGYVYAHIKFAVSSGDVAPFVGHNAVLRWSAIQDVAIEEEGRDKYWSESTVSEDFDLALRLQSAGWIVRLCGYHGHDFKEGVSLTVYDELARWQKYAYGCSEIVFHPIRLWAKKSPITPLFRQFLTSQHIPLTYKFTTMAYIGSYYAIGSAWVLTFANYFLSGWLNGSLALDTYYLNSYKIWFAVIVSFTALGNIAIVTVRYRLGEQDLWKAILENLLHLPVLVVFLQGLSIHLSKALVIHLLGLDISWSATAKELELDTFFHEMRKVIVTFRGTLAFCFGCTAMMITFTTIVPESWQITLFIAVFPLAALLTTTFLLPVGLNPGLMRFMW